MTTDRPPPDDAAERMLEIARRARRRSTQVTQLAELAALELDTVGADAGSRATLIRGYLDRAVDAATQWHSEQLARVMDELAAARESAAEADRLRARAEAAERHRRDLQRAVLRYLRGEIEESDLRAALYA
jgi:hypothetical protein